MPETDRETHEPQPLDLRVNIIKFPYFGYTRHSARGTLNVQLEIVLLRVRIPKADYFGKMYSRMFRLVAIADCLSRFALQRKESTLKQTYFIVYFLT